jgi:hypothetical protein
MTTMDSFTLEEDGSEDNMFDERSIVDDSDDIVDFDGEDY